MSVMAIPDTKLITQLEFALTASLLPFNNRYGHTIISSFRYLYNWASAHMSDYAKKKESQQPVYPILESPSSKLKNPLVQKVKPYGQSKMIVHKRRP